MSASKSATMSEGRASARRPVPERPAAILVVDDHPIVLQGVRRLAEAAGVGTVYEAADIVSGYRLFHRHQPDLVVADLSFRDDGLSGLSLIRRIRALDGEARILVFSMHADPVLVSRALESGALGFALKDAGPDAFHEALDAVHAGQGYLPHALATDVAMLNRSARPAPLATLSARELQILSLLSQGKSYEAIANAMAVSYRTIINASSSMRRKLGVESRAGLVQIAVNRRNALL